MTHDTRDRLLDAAAELMAVHGYAATSMRAIAAHAGVTTGALYARFPGGKEDLFRGILGEVGETLHRDAAAAMDGAAGPVDFVLRQAASLWDVFARRPGFAALVVRESVSGALGDPSPFVAQNAAYLRELRQLFSTAMERGAMAPVNTSYVLFWVVTTCATFHGCRPLADAVWTPEEREGARSQFLRALEELLRPR